jgi:hypothetical protein
VGPEQPTVVVGPEQPKVVVGPEQPKVLAGPEQPNDLVGPEQPNDLVGPEQPNDLVGPEQPNDLVGPEPPKVSAGPEQPKVVVGPEQPKVLVEPEQPNYLVGPEQPNDLVGPEQPNDLVGSEQPKVLVRGQQPERTNALKIKVVRTKEKPKSVRTKRQRNQKVPEPPPLNEWIKAIQAWQEEDTILRTLNAWEEKPNWADVSRASPEIKYFWSRWNQLKKQDGIWYYQWKEEHGNRLKIIVPSAGQEEILKGHHNHCLAGHFCVEKTLKRLRQSPYYWPKLRDTVEKLCRDCHVCARTKPGNTQHRAPMQDIGAGSTLT